MDPSRENPPPYSEVAGGPPPPGFVHPVQPQPASIQQTTVYSTVPVNQTYYPNSGQTVVLTTVPTTAPVVLMGGCPSCRVGVLRDSFTCAGIFLCILFFPLGIICLLCMTQKVCSNCGATF